MKNLLFLSSTLLISTISLAQNVGINNSGATPAASAMLDIVATDKGLLVPRVALTALNAAGPITSPATSLLVYNTATAGTAPNNVIPGYYYWDGSTWVSFGGSGGKDWSLLGNAGTAAATNFIGTTDVVDFSVRTANAERMRFLSGGNIGIGTTTPAYKFETKLNIGGTYVASFENTNSTGAAIQAYNNAGTLNALGGVTNIAGGTGVYGVVLPTTGAGAAVYGTTNSSNAIGVRGSIPTTGTWTGFGGYFSGGLGYVNGLYNLSDSRVKTDVVKIENAIDKLKKIEGVTYKYNSKDYPGLANGDNRTYLGFIAQNVKDVFPEAVAEKSIPVSGEINGNTADLSKNKYEIFNVVDYTAIVPVLVEAMKEQQLQIEKLKLQIKAMEEKTSKK